MPDLTSFQVTDLVGKIVPPEAADGAAPVVAGPCQCDVNSICLDTTNTGTPGGPGSDGCTGTARLSLKGLLMDLQFRVECTAKSAAGDASAGPAA
jgi:hypothetical protein